MTKFVSLLLQEAAKRNEASQPVKLLGSGITELATGQKDLPLIIGEYSKKEMLTN